MLKKFMAHLAHRALLISALITQAHAADFILSEARPIVESPAINEASGLAASPKDDTFLWAINDSGGTPDLHLLKSDGTDCGKVTLTNAKNVDWEDLASFTLDGKSYLLIADTGDNASTRESCTLHIIPEPKLPAAGEKLSGTATSAWNIVFSYEGGPRDCEAVAVDSINQKIILISKRTSPPEIFELPLRAPQKRGKIIARKSGIVLTNSPSAHFLPFANQPVGLDISVDQSLAAIATYYSVFLFPRAPKETWAQAFAKKPITLTPHGLKQAESIAFSKDASQIHLISEGKTLPIRSYKR